MPVKAKTHTPFLILRGSREGVERVQVWYRVPDEELFRIYMRKAGHNGQSLAESVGCTRQAISLLAKGQRTCRPELADKISEALKRDREDIFLRCVERVALKSSTNTSKKVA